MHFVWNSDPPDSENETGLISRELMGQVGQFHMGLPGYAQTPLYHMQRTAEMLGIKALYIKDEGARFGLQSFKALGASWAMWNILRGCSGPDPVFATATDGNHGRGVAWAASMFNCRAIVHMPAGSSLQRVKAIRALGAQCHVTTCNYDETVRELSLIAAEKGWLLIQDTSWKGYEHVPRLIMQGYGTIVAEIIEQLENSQQDFPTHVFLQAGVGSFAGAIIAAFAASSTHMPVFIIVEPEAACCIFNSLGAGEIKRVDGSLETIMAGLACGVPSVLGWSVIRKHATAALAGPDSMAISGVRLLASNPDQGINAGESGAATAGALVQLLTLQNMRENCEKLKLDRNARVLLINTEGPTDLQSWQKIAGICSLQGCR